MVASSLLIYGCFISNFYIFIHWDYVTDIWFFTNLKSDNTAWKVSKYGVFSGPLGKYVFEHFHKMQLLLFCA